MAYHDFVVLSDWDAAHVVLFAELLAERGAHQLTSNVRRRREVSPPVLTARRRHKLVELHSTIYLSNINNTSGLVVDEKPGGIHTRLYGGRNNYMKREKKEYIERMA